MIEGFRKVKIINILEKQMGKKIKLYFKLIKINI